METIKNSLRESKIARWSALGIISITMFAGYFLTDVMSPLKPMLEEQFGWSSTGYGLFTSAYGWFNVFMGMLIFGGIILDKMGVRFTGVMAAGIMVLGAALKYWAIAYPDLSEMTIIPEFSILGFDSSAVTMKSQVFFASLGFAIFGVGVEIAGITVSKILVKWFKGKEMALAMGMQMAIARLGTTLAMLAPVPLAMYFASENGGSVSAPIAFALVLLVIGFLTFFIYVGMDKKLEASEGNVEVSEEDKFKFSDIFEIIVNKGFWLIAILCVLFYSSVFPFLKYAADLMVNKYGLDQELAGTIPGLLPFGTIILTPIFGGIYDKKGKGATIMIIGAVLILLVHSVFAIPETAVPVLNTWIVAVILVIILGIALSLVPSAMWPSAPKIIPEKQLGTAFSLIFWIQNWGLMGIPLLIGYVLDKSNPEVLAAKEQGLATIPAYDYTNPMLIFAGLGVLAILVGFLLKREDKRKGYGLELPNIEK